MTSYPYLFTASTSNQICQHPLNFSPAKQQYSFPHAQRFGKPKQNFNCKAEFYTINEQLFKTQRSCSLGKGERYDFGRKSHNAPAPTAYFPKNDSIESNKNKGFSFGVSRDSCPQFSIAPTLKSAGQKPGPGAYTPVLPKTGRNTTFHIRPRNLSTSNPNLGPGKYDIVSTFQPSKLILNSKYQSTKNVKIMPDPTSSKENHTARDRPSNFLKDNGAHELSQDKTYQINRLGVFFNSKYKNSFSRYFGKQRRTIFESSNNFPGPGTYRQPSEFGLYETSRVHSQTVKFR